MVAVVGLAGERREANGQERYHLDAMTAQTLDEVVVQAPTADVIIDDAHLDTPLGTVYQGIGEQASQGVVLDDIHIDMNMVTRCSHVAQQLGEEGVAIGDDIHLVVLEG